PCPQGLSKKTPESPWLQTGILALRSNHNATYVCTFHVVFCPRYRRKVLVPPLDARLKEIVREQCVALRQDLRAVEVQPDHVHVLVGCDPQVGIHRHQEARKIVDRQGAIAVEGLRIKNMVRNPCLAKSISDAGWNQFLNILTHKAAEAGVVTDPSECRSRLWSGFAA